MGILFFILFLIYTIMKILLINNTYEAVKEMHEIMIQNNGFIKKVYMMLFLLEGKINYLEEEAKKENKKE